MLKKTPNRRFAIRTVRNGTVKINGKFYRPDEYLQKYDGRFDNQRFAFGLYMNSIGSDLGFISLWGTERDYKEKEAFGADFGKWPVCNNGVFEFACWYKS